MACAVSIGANKPVYYFTCIQADRCSFDDGFVAADNDHRFDMRRPDAMVILAKCTGVVYGSCEAGVGDGGDRRFAVDACCDNEFFTWGGLVIVGCDESAYTISTDTGDALVELDPVEEVKMVRIAV